MKVVAFNGSPHRNGNTSILIGEMFKIMETSGFDTELVQLGNKTVHGCTACGLCKETGDAQCHIKNEYLNLALKKCWKPME